MTYLDDAIRALDKALSRLEENLHMVIDQAGDPALARKEVDALLADRARLAGELDSSLARETELQVLADEASVALGSAISEVRAALEKQGNVTDG